MKGKLGKRQLSMTMVMIMLNEYGKMLKMIIILMLENNPDSRVGFQAGGRVMDRFV